MNERACAKDYDSKSGKGELAFLNGQTEPVAARGSTVRGRRRRGATAERSEDAMDGQRIEDSTETQFPFRYQNSSASSRVGKTSHPEEAIF